MAPQPFDFIIVGGGTSGCALASRFSRALKDYQVLLLEAGGANTNPDYQTYGERGWTLASAPGYNWGYKTVTQAQLGREIDQSRGKGLGGSSAINFCVYTRGPRADYDHWAEQIGDDTWCWENVLQRYKKIESFHDPPQEQHQWVNPVSSAHGYDGVVDVGLTGWESDFGEFLDGVYNFYTKNLDVNSGNPLGASVCQISAHDGRRTTASGAYLSDVPSNLTIVTDVIVERIVFNQGKAVAVTTDEGQYIFANKEVTLAAGALDTPKLLLLSGIGPVAELSKHRIPLVMDLPGVGNNPTFRDHFAFEGNYAARGSVTLTSADPKDPPVIDPKFLEKPFDRRVAIEAVRESLEFLDSPQIAKDQVCLAAGPENRSDEAIINYVRKTAMSMWHCSGTAKMGKMEQPDTCVDNNFRVFGVDRLRVADMSVAPFLLSAHTQAAAYLIGKIAAEKIIADYV